MPGVSEPHDGWPQNLLVTSMQQEKDTANVLLASQVRCSGICCSSSTGFDVAMYAVLIGNAAVQVIRMSHACKMCTASNSCRLTREHSNSAIYTLPD